MVETTYQQHYFPYFSINCQKFSSEKQHIPCFSEQVNQKNQMPLTQLLIKYFTTCNFTFFHASRKGYSRLYEQMHQVLFSICQNTEYLGYNYSTGRNLPVSMRANRSKQIFLLLSPILYILPLEDATHIQSEFSEPQIIWI